MGSMVEGGAPRERTSVNAEECDWARGDCVVLRGLWSDRRKVIEWFLCGLGRSKKGVQSTCESIHRRVERGVG